MENNITNLEELSFLIVFAFPNASNKGFDSKNISFFKKNYDSINK